MSIGAWSQTTCKRSSTLFKFDSHTPPRNFTEKLGNHPQFPFLQKDSGVTTRNLFIKAVKNPANRKRFKIEFDVFNKLLKDIGFAGGYKDLKAADIENLYINPGTIGNLGFFNKQNGYIYVKLDPAGEDEDGIAAWRITGPQGCDLYILHTCGNAFFAKDPNDSRSGGPGCCKTIGVKVTTDTVRTDTAHNRSLHLVITFYQGVITAGRKKTDTTYRLMRSLDTTAILKDSAGRAGKVYAKEYADRWVLCKDTTLELHVPLNFDTAAGKLEYKQSDTTYIRLTGKGKDECHNKWEIDANGGGSFNSIPRFDNTTQHSRTNGAQPYAELDISRIFSPSFQLGVSAAYMTLSYQDDIAYPGAAPNTYNTVYPAKPMIPVQLFGRFTIGGPKRWQANVSLSAGYSFVSGGKIRNSGNTLASKPGTRGGITAGVGMSVAYFFTCKFGLALNVSGQYFNNPATAMTYHLVALPVSLGLRFRF